jgi:hypothetical protein
VRLCFRGRHLVACYSASLRGLVPALTGASSGIGPTAAGEHAYSFAQLRGQLLARVISCSILFA